MNNSKHSIQNKLLTLVLMPIIILSIVIILLASIFIFQFATSNTKEKLSTTNAILHECLEMTIPGDYACSNGILTKGKFNISDATLLFALSNSSDIDATIFWEDTRILTTIEDNYGVSAIGTKADSEIAEYVLKKGQKYFTTHVSISGKSYIGYYSPLMNSDNSIVGMIFTGTPLKMVIRSISSAIFLFLIISVLAAIVNINIINTYTGKLIIDINSMKNFLRNISTGNFTDSSIQNPVSRNDEIGEIGTYAQEMAKSLREYIQYDTLTTLFNRRTCVLNMEDLVSKQTSFTIALCDIDFFKKINDTYGHDCGDYILREISTLFRSYTQDFGFAARWGGEEFLLIYTIDKDAAVKTISDLLTEIRNHNFIYNGTTIHVTITIGVSECTESLSYQDAIKEADDKLYQGKTNGRNTIIY